MIDKFNEQLEPYWDFPEHDLRLKIYDIILSYVDVYADEDGNAHMLSGSIRDATNKIIEELQKLEIYKDKNIEWQ
jgi:hypothetical protein